MDPTDQNRKAWDEIHRRRAEAMSGQLGIPDGIRELLPEVEGKHVLHLQCATGEATAQLVELGALVTATDLSTEALEDRARAGARRRVCPCRRPRASPRAAPWPFRRRLHRRPRASLAPRPRRLGSRDRIGPQARRALLVYDSHPVTECVDPLGHWRDNYFDEIGGGDRATSASSEHWQLGEVVDAVVGAGLSVTRLAEFQTLYTWLQRDRRVPWDFALLAEKRE